MKRLLLLCIVLLFSLKFYAQFTLSGKIIDNNENPLPGAIVILNGKFSTSSDEQGYFLLKNLSQDEYTIEVRYMGFENFTKKIEINKNVFIEIALKPTFENELDQIVIKGTRADNKAPFVYTEIQEENIKRNNYGQDIPFLLKTTPSLVVNSDAGNGIGYTSMTIRGTDITRINVTLNGIPLNDPESHGVYWVDIPDFASSVNSIQIQRGIGTSTNGAGAFGASINLKTNKITPKPYAFLNNSYGSFNTQKNSINFGTGIINKHFSFDGRLSRLHSDGYIDRARSDMKSFYIAGTYFDKKTLIKLIIFSGLEETYQAWYGVPKDSLLTNRTYNPYTYDNEIDHYGQTHYQLHLVRKITDNLKFNISGFFVKGKGYYEQYKNNEDYSDYGLNNVIIQNDTITSTDLIRRKWLDNDFFGANYNFIFIKNNLNLTLGGSWSNYIGYHFGRIIWMQYAGNIPIRYEWYNNHGIKNDFNNYLKINYGINEKINIYADLQYRIINYQIKGIDDNLSDISQLHKYNFFNPKTGINYQLNENNRIFGSFAVAKREPKRSDFVDAPTDKTPNPETLYDYELTYVFKKKNVYFEANAYYMNYKNQLILTGEINDVGAPIVTNTPESFRRGIELSFASHLFNSLTWSSNSTLSQNKIKNFTEYVDNWNYWDDPANQPLQIKNNLGETDISFSPSVIASNTITYKFMKNFSFDLISKYVSRQYIDNTSSLERSIDPYFVNDAQFNINFNPTFVKQIKLSFRLNNFLNEMYETNAWVYSYYDNGERHQMNGYFPQAGRNFIINLQIHF